MNAHEILQASIFELTRPYRIPFKVYKDEAGELQYELFVDAEDDNQLPMPDGTLAEAVLTAKREEVRVREDWRELREERDKRIAETDWWVAADRTATAEQLAYRQALRDLPANTTDPANPVWPVKPE